MDSSLEDRVRKLAKRVKGLPKDGGQFRGFLIDLIKLLDAGQLTHSELEQELEELRNTLNDNEWTP
jgi:hypothetical protein